MKPLLIKTEKVMRKIVIIIILGLTSMQSYAQTVKFKSSDKKNSEVKMIKTFQTPVINIKKAGSEKIIKIDDTYTDWKADTTNSDDTTIIRKNDTTEIKIGKTRIVVIGDSKVDKIYTDEDTTSDGKNSISIGKKSDKYEKSYFGLDLGFTSYLDNGSFDLKNNDLELRPGKSSHVALIYHKKINIINKRVNFIPGLGISWYNYRFEKDITPKKDTSVFSYTIDQNVNLSKNKLTATYLEVPLMLQFQANSTKKGKEGFRIAAGMEFGYLLGGKSKQKSEKNGKQKQRDDYNLQAFRYGAVARIAYQNFSFYGKYALNDLFQDSDPTKLTPVSFGISFGGF